MGISNPAGFIISHTVGGSSKTAKTNSGFSAVGFLVAAAIVATLYEQFPGLRPLLAGMIILVVLGILLRYQPTITSQFKQVFSS